MPRWRGAKRARPNRCKPLTEGAWPSARPQEGQRHTEVAGALEQFPDGLTGERAKTGRLDAPEHHPEHHGPQRHEQDEQADGDVDGADHRHQPPRPGLGDPPDGEVRHPDVLGDDPKGAMPDETGDHGDP